MLGFFAACWAIVGALITATIVNLPLAFQRQPEIETHGRHAVYRGPMCVSVHFPVWVRKIARGVGLQKVWTSVLQNLSPRSSLV